MYYLYIKSDNSIIGKGECPMSMEGETIINEEVSEEIFNDYEPEKYIYTKDGVILNPQWETVLFNRRKKQFETDFFETSLGWIRRSVNMNTGENKDFISDLLPSIKMGVESGIDVKVITYTMPDFSEEVIDWKKYQTYKSATSAFIKECIEQLQNDFKPVN